ncbi:hypothetical protein LINGRAHAP2_LOCUS15719 [Linum grandiflorum]
MPRCQVTRPVSCKHQISKNLPKPLKNNLGVQSKM